MARMWKARRIFMCKLLEQICEHHDVYPMKDRFRPDCENCCVYKQWMIEKSEDKV